MSWCMHWHNVYGEQCLLEAMYEGPLYRNPSKIRSLANAVGMFGRAFGEGLNQS
jgi:hypothetical protein